MSMASPTSPIPERKASAVTIEEIERGRRHLVQAALVFDAIEDEDEAADWRVAFKLLRETARELGNLNVLDYAGIG